MKRKVNGHTFHVPNHGSGIYSYIRNWKKEREPYFVKLMKLEIHPGMTVFEIGTNIGYYTFIMAKLLNGKGKIHAIEPHPNNYKYLKKNIIVNNYKKLIIPHNVAVGNANGIIDFYVDTDKPNLSTSVKRKGCKVIKVQCTTLDKFISKFGNPNFIKMDIEGAEVDVLHGLFNSLNESFPLKILIETHPLAYNNVRNMESVLTKLVNLGFNIKYVVSAGHIIPKIFKDYGYSPNKKLCIEGLNRGIYTKISNKDAINFSSFTHGEWCQKKNKKSNRSVRYVMFERGK